MAERKRRGKPVVSKDTPKKKVSGALAKAHKVMAEKRAAGEITRLDPIEKAKQNPKSLRLSVNAMCYDCVGAGADTGTRKLIGTCQITECPLHSVRPYQHKQEQSNDE